MNLQMIMQQAQKMQKELARKVEQFDAQEFEIGYQNNLVVVKLNGSLKLLNISINQDLVDPEDKQTLEEMICEAVNNAVSQVKKQKDAITSSAMPKGMPGLF